MRRSLLVVVALLVAPMTFSAQQHHKPKKNPKQLRSDLSRIEVRKAQIRKELAKTRAATHDVQVDIQQLDTNLSNLADQLDRTQSSLKGSRQEQLRLSSQLREATQQVGQVRDQVRKRLRYMYVHQGESVLSAFMGVKSVGEIASRKVILEAIANKDRSLFDQYRELQSRIHDRKIRQDAVVVRIATLKNQQIDQQADLEVTREQKGDALHSLKNKQNQLKQLLGQLEADEASVYAEIRAYEAVKRPAKPGEKPLNFNGRFSRPSNGPITSTFGMRYHPILHYTRLHAGIDFGARTGSPIRAAADGTVIAAQYSRSFGNMVIIDHGNGVSTVYAHGSRLYVHRGQTVKRGQVIAAVGSTGLATGPHLHWEVRINGKPVNPMGRF